MSAQEKERVSLLAAIGRGDVERMASITNRMLRQFRAIPEWWRGQVLTAAMVANLRLRNRDEAARLWRRHGQQVARQEGLDSLEKMALQLVYAHTFFGSESGGDL